MTKERNAFKAGLFIIVSIALIFMVTVMIKGVGRLAEPMADRKVAFGLTDNLAGLRVGDDARVGGLKMGTVRSINLESQTDGSSRIVVAFTIPARLALHKNTHIAVESKLTGASDLNIDNLGDGEKLGDNEMLVGSPDALTSMIAGASSVMPIVKATVSDLKSQTLPRANGMLDKFSGTADTGKEALAQIRDVVGDTKTDIRATMKNVNSATATIDKKLPVVMDDLHAVLEKAKSTIDGITVALEDMKKTAANARNITASLRSVVVGNKTKLDTMIASLKTAADNLKNTTAEVRHSPWRLLYKPTPDEVGNLTLYDSARHFSEGANSLNDAAGALRDALKDPNSKDDPEKIKVLVDQLDKSFESFNQVEDELLKSVKH